MTVKRELRAFGREVILEIKCWTLLAVIMACYPVPSLFASAEYKENSARGETFDSASARWAIIYGCLAVYGSTAFVVCIVSGILDGWWLGIVSPVFWQSALALYAL